MRISKAILLLAILTLIAGCASIVSKSTYPVFINSSPDQAEITIKDEFGNVVYKGKTPTTVTLNAGAGFFKGKDYTVSFKREGYSNHVAQIKRGLDGWYLGGNILFGGLIGWFIVDPITGAMWTLDNLHVTLYSESSSLSSEKSLKIVMLEDVPENLRANMIRVK